MTRLRFHLDENVHIALAAALRRRGIDVTTVEGIGLRSADDAKQLAHAAGESRVFVTHDQDFLRLHSEGAKHAGIAYCALGSRSIGEMLQALQLIAEALSPEEMANHLEFI